MAQQLSVVAVPVICCVLNSLAQPHAHTWSGGAVLNIFAEKNTDNQALERFAVDFVEMTDKQFARFLGRVEAEQRAGSKGEKVGLPESLLKAKARRKLAQNPPETAQARQRSPKLRVVK